MEREKNDKRKTKSVCGKKRKREKREMRESTVHSLISGVPIVES